MADTDSRDEIAGDRLQPYRQPLITGTGIILGFVLNFAGSFVKAESGTPEWAAYLVFVLLLVGVACLITVLSRILRLGVSGDEAVAWYQRTRQIFVIGVGCAVAGALVDMLSNFMAD